MKINDKTCHVISFFFQIDDDKERKEERSW